MIYFIVLIAVFFAGVYHKEIMEYIKKLIEKIKTKKNLNEIKEEDKES